MKHSLLHLLSVGFLSCLTGCSGDDSSAPSENTVDTQGTSHSETLSDSVVGANNRLIYAGSARPLDNGIVDIINDARGHLEVDFNISDSDYEIAFYQAGGFLYSYWFAPNDTVSFNADLYSPSTTVLAPGTYEYVDISAIRNGDSTLGQAVFSQASVGWDFNDDGNVDSDEELDVVQGTVQLSINGSNQTSFENATLSWDVLLVDGKRSTGNYQGGFTLVD